MTPVTNSPTANEPAQGQSTAPAPAKTPVTDFDTFLQMLTAQARYQDPLEPIDSTEYAAQLAQFSMVEQQTLTNSTLSALVDKLGASDVSKLSDWIGTDVRAVAPKHYTGAPVTISPRPQNGTDQAYLVVRDHTGSIVHRSEIPVSDKPVTWTGQTDGDAPLPHGLYSFSVQSYKGGVLLDDAPAATYHKVSEAQIDNNEVVLVLDGGQAIRSSLVTGVRASA